MRITLHQLHVFSMVSKYGSVSTAAQKLHMSQPAVSNIIKHLENYYQCSLTEVISRKLSLTQFGDILVKATQTIETTLSDTLTEIEMLKGGVSGTLSVAIVSTAKYFVPRLLGTFKQEFSRIHVKLTVCNREQILQRLENNEDDFVIMSHPPSTMRVDCADFFDDELIIAASSLNELTKKRVLSLSELNDESWILREPGSGTRFATVRIFKKHKFTPKTEMEISDNETIKQAIMANIGISVIPKQSIQLELQQKLIKTLPVRNFPIKHTWYLVKNKGKALHPIAEKFYAYVNKVKPTFTDVYK